MTSGSDLRVSELLAARLCHELVGPISAVANGADLLREHELEIDQEALALIGESARRAGSRLQFYRFAYGFCGNGHVTGPPPDQLAAGYFASSRVACRYGQDVRTLPLSEQKLGCNLLVFGAEALIRGGHVALAVENGGFRLEAAGEGISLAREQSRALALTTPLAELTSQTVHGYFTGLLAKAQGCQLVADATTPGRLYIRSTPAR
jgi:histidine phosphotransferase ChpT